MAGGIPRWCEVTCRHGAEQCYWFKKKGADMWRVYISNRSMRRAKERWKRTKLCPLQLGLSTPQTRQSSNWKQKNRYPLQLGFVSSVGPFAQGRLYQQRHISQVSIIDKAIFLKQRISKVQSLKFWGFKVWGKSNPDVFNQNPIKPPQAC